VAERILRTFAACISHGLVPNSFPDRPDQPLDRGSYNTVDATLWFFQALAEHRAASGSDALVRELVPWLEAIITTTWPAPGSVSAWIRPMAC
jgi:glycogen debranching enzyme